MRMKVAMQPLGFGVVLVWWVFHWWEEGGFVEGRSGRGETNMHARSRTIAKKAFLRSEISAG